MDELDWTLLRKLFISSDKSSLRYDAPPIVCTPCSPCVNHLLLHSAQRRLSKQDCYYQIKTTCGEGSRVLQLERVRLRREGGGLASSSMERGWLSRLLTWVRWGGEVKVIKQWQDDDALTWMRQDCENEVQTKND